MTDTKQKIQKYKEAEEAGKARQSSRENQPEETEEADETAADPVKELEKRLEESENTAKETHDKYLRAYADFENYKKRSVRDMEEFRKYANESLLAEILTVVDNLERAIQSSTSEAASKDPTPIVEGIEITLKEVLGILEKFHVQPVESLGKPFDPKYHQAFQQEESDEYPDNTVTKEFQKGYMLHDRLLRPAMVVVSKSTQKSDK